MTDILQTILQRKIVEVAENQSRCELSALQNKILDLPPTRDFRGALEAQQIQQKPAVIAEIKRASPSKGLLRDPFFPTDIATDYARHGATCLSVLTDRDFFQGHDDYLQAAKRACNLPILRKDFIVSDYQIYESRVIGADAILLIVSALSLEQLQTFAEIAFSLDLAVLVEVHDENEMALALMLDSKVILGVNNRNLRTFETSLQTSVELRKLAPDRLFIAESGILTPSDVQQLRAANIHAFLVGEAFMRAPSPGQKLAELFFEVSE